MGPYSIEYMDELKRQEEVKRRLKEKMAANPSLNPNLPKNFISRKDKEGNEAQQKMVSTQSPSPGPSSKMQDGDMDVTASQEIDPRMRLREMLMTRNQNPDASMYLQQMGAARDANAMNQLGALMAQTSSKMGTLQGKRADVANFQPLIESIYNRDVGPIEDIKTLEAMQAPKPFQIKELEMGLRADESGEKRRMNAENMRINQEKLNLQLREQEERERANRAKEAIDREKGDKPIAEKPPSDAQAAAKQKADVAMSALPSVEEMELSGYRPGSRSVVAATLPKEMGNYILNEKDQLYRTYINVVVNQILRSETGAAASESEIRNMLATYAAQPGDKDSVIRAKQKLRRDYIDAMLGKAGPAAKDTKIPAMKESSAPSLQKPKFLYSQSRNKTKIVYPDGREKIVDGYVTEEPKDGGR